MNFDLVYHRNAERLLEEQAKRANDLKMLLEKLGPIQRRKLIETGPRNEGLDIAFLVDCTYGMEVWVQAVKNISKNLIQAIRESLEVKGRIRIGFVGYGDYDPSTRSSMVEVHDLDDNLVHFRKFVSDIQGFHGYDFPEDVAGGLHRCRQLLWKEEKRILIHLADAPPHGRKYYNDDYDDNYASGDPAGRDCEDLLRNLIKKEKVNYVFPSISSNTAIMEKLFKEIVEAEGKRWLGSSYAEPEMLLPVVVAAVSNIFRKDDDLAQI